MKLIFLTLFLPSLLFSSDFSKFSSVNVDFVGVVANGDKIAAYGTNGSVYYSDDDSQTWDIIKPFQTGNIVNFFIENDRLVAFLQTGEVSQSYDNGISWTVSKPINDSVSYVIKGDDDYFARCKSSIIKLNADLSFSKKLNYTFGVVSNIEDMLGSSYRSDLSFFNDKLYVISTDSRSIFTLDKNLDKLDSVNIGEQYFNSNNIGILSIKNNSESLIISFRNYTLDSNYIYKLNLELTEINFLFNITDRTNIFEGKSLSVEVFNDKIYILKYSTDSKFNSIYDLFEVMSKDSVVFIDKINTKSHTSNFRYSNFIVNNDKLTIVRNNNYIVTKNFNLDTVHRISNLGGADNYSNIFQINDSDYLLIAPKNIYKSIDTAKTFRNVEGDTSIFQSYYRYKTRFSFFSDDAKSLLYFAYIQGAGDLNGLPYVLLSEDYGEHFSRKQLEGVSLRNLANSYSINNINNNYLISEINFGNNKVNYFVYDDKFNLIDSILDSQYFLLYGFGKNIDEYKAIGRSSNFDEYNQYILSTQDGGKSWDKIRTFSFAIDTMWYDEEDSTKYVPTKINELQYYKQIKINSKDYLLFATYNKSDSLYKIEAMDIETNDFSLLYQNKQSAYSNTLIELIEDEYYICKGDTLFTTADLLDYSTWKGHQLPNNGTMTTKIMKSGNYLITYYYDDVLPFEIYRIKWNDLINTDISSEDIESYKYIYATPPYPQPTSSLVTTDVYLEKGILLTQDNITIYDINGTQVENGENVTLNGSNWPQKLTWDSSNQPPGIYFIVLNYGDFMKSIKVAIE